MNILDKLKRYPKNYNFESSDEAETETYEELDEDIAEGMADDPRYANLDYGNEHANEGNNISDGKSVEPKYKPVNIPDEEEMAFETRRLAIEQKELLTKVVHYCKEVVKATYSPHERPTPLRLIIHGGAGNIYEFELLCF